ncbi:MAG: glycosyltransferase [bacterium]|nr:glycosyltransferase [bacterium]
MKLVYLANMRLPTERAHGVQIMKMCEAFSDLGAQVLLVLPRRFTKIKADPFEYYSVKRNFAVVKLPVLDLIPLDSILGNLAFWIEALTFLFCAKIYLLFKDYELLYTRDDWAGLFFKNFILEIHTLPGRVKNFHRDIWRKAAAFITITKNLKNHLAQNGVPEEKIFTASDGVELSEFSVRTSKKEARLALKLPLDKKIVMFIGLFDAWKGYETVLEASRSFALDTKLVMIGGREEQVKTLRQKYPEVVFAGYLPYKSLPRNQRAADVLVIPNSAKYEISKYHTSPLKLFAHMASGVPIVASDLPSLGEVLSESNSLLVEPDNPEALAEGIRKILADRALGESLSGKALEEVKKYTWQNRARGILDFIRENHV